MGSSSGGAAAGGSAAGGASAAATTASTATTGMTSVWNASAISGAAGQGISWAQYANYGFQALSLNAAGNAAATKADMEKFMSKEQAAALQAQGAKDANDIRERLLRTMAANNAAAGASGISLASGSVTNAQTQAQRTAERELSTARDNTAISARVKNIEASQFKRTARNSLFSSYLDQGALAFNTLSTQRRIGEA